MAKFIQVQSPDKHSYYINVETVEYVAQNREDPRFICDTFHWRTPSANRRIRGQFY